MQGLSEFQISSSDAFGNEKCVLPNGEAEIIGKHEFEDVKAQGFLLPCESSVNKIKKLKCRRTCATGIGKESTSGSVSPLVAPFSPSSLMELLLLRWNFAHRGGRLAGYQTRYIVVRRLTYCRHQCKQSLALRTPLVLAPSTDGSLEPSCTTSLPLDNGTVLSQLPPVFQSPLKKCLGAAPTISSCSFVSFFVTDLEDFSSPFICFVVPSGSFGDSTSNPKQNIWHKLKKNVQQDIKSKSRITIGTQVKAPISESSAILSCEVSNNLLDEFRSTASVKSSPQDKVHRNVVTRMRATRAEERSLPLKP
ncbi:Protein trichome birefringence-like 16 [Senna tora]|uniref:Protein trichome birefringence-like 16 n=1 Tax=Senna tora TaxID=362788 RepID=A0A834WXK7_9FABA|nr:Protein trichome birefringence-like 16 [Senna tora]